MAFQDGDEVTLAIPESGSVVVTGSEDTLAVRGEDSRIDTRCVAFEDSEGRALTIPQPGGAVQ